MLVIGHRGCSYPGYNQNTVRAFKKVLDQGCPAIEFDVQRTIDEELVIVHNLNLSEVSDGEGLINSVTSNYIKGLRAGKNYEIEDKIPSLYDLLDSLKSYSGKFIFHLELKGKNTGFQSANLVKDFLDKNIYKLDDFLISSFNWKELDEFRKVLPKVKIALLDGSIIREDLIKECPEAEVYFKDIFAYGEEDYMLIKYRSLDENKNLIYKIVKDERIREILVNQVISCLNADRYNDNLIENALKRGATSLNLWFFNLNKAFVEKAHKNNLLVLVYTANKNKDLDLCKSLNVDGLFTDFYKDTLEYLN